MEQFVKSLDPNLKYVNHEEVGDTLLIYVKSARKRVRCPYCGEFSDRVHSRYTRRFKDVPVDGKKVEIILENRKFYCLNGNCDHRTFAEVFDCFSRKGRRTHRLTEVILEAASSQSC